MQWFNSLSRAGKIATLLGGLVVLYLCFFGAVFVIGHRPRPTPTVVAIASPTLTAVPPTATSVLTTNTPLPLTLTPILPTGSPLAPTATPIPPTVTSVPPTRTAVRATPTPRPTSTPAPTATPAFLRPTSSTLEGTISENTVLDLVRSPYVVKGALTVNQGVTLLIQPGVVVKFMDDAHLKVYGSLRAQGASDQHIVFTSIKDDSHGGDTNQDGGSSAPAPGDWTYIGFFDSSNDTNCIVEHALIRYAGEHRGNRYGAIYMAAASPTITNNTISDSFWYAISADANSFPVVKGNTLADNQGNGLEVQAGTLSASGAWANTDVIYSVTGVVSIAENATLTIQPGVTVKFGDDVYIDVFGALKVQGTSEQQVVLTSIKDDASGGDTNGDAESSIPAAGDWTMIRFKDSSNDANSLIAHSVIQYAGEHRGNRFGAIHLEAASPTITNNVLTDNHWYAISADVNSFPTVSDNSLKGNVGNGLEIRNGEMSLSGTWKNDDIAYSVTGVVTVKEGTTLSIAPGVIVKFSDNTYIDVFGTFRAQGMAEQEVIFTSIKDDGAGGDTNGDEGSSAPAPGDWTMIRFKDSSNDANSIVEYAVIRYAGEHNGNRFGAIHLESASPTIANNVITDNFWYAISIDVHSFPSVSGNQVSGNVGNGLEVRGGEMRSSGTWENTDIVYSVLAPITVKEGATLSVEAGVMVKFGDNAYFDVYGTFRAIGTDEHRVTFTSIKDDAIGGDTNGDEGSSAPSAGDWTMIRFRDTSNDASSIVKHAIIRYAGEHNKNRFGAIHLESASPTIANNVITDNFWHAISADVHSFPSVSGNELLRNLGNGLEIRSGEMRTSGAWANTDIAYVVTGPVTVRDTATLSIAAGATVKFAENTYIDVHGAFRSVGTAEMKVILTSLKDDTNGGDTNGDGSSSTATPGDWTMIRFYDDSNDTNCIIDHTVIRYAGRHGGNKYGAIHILSASPTISNSTINDSFFYGIWYDANSSPKLSNNTFSRNVEGDVFQKQ